MLEAFLKPSKGLKTFLPSCFHERSTIAVSSAKALTRADGCLRETMARKVWVAMAKSKGERGQPCLIPLSKGTASYACP